MRKMKDEITVAAELATSLKKKDKLHAYVLTGAGT